MGPIKKGSKLYRIFFLLLIALQLPQVAIAAPREKPTSGNGTSASPYKIANKENLLWFSEQVSKEGEGGICAELVNDINLGDVYSSLCMIGTPDNPFWGEFNGNNHIISGVILDDVHKYGPNDYLYAGGIFGCIKVPSGTTAVVKNLTVEGTLTKNAIERTYYIGGVIGIAYGNVDVSNVISRVNITIGKNSKYAHCGGIVGSAEWFDPKKQDGKLNVRDCINYGTINVSCAENCGGIVGYIREGTITDCLNVGNITNSEEGTTGGILGYVNTTAFSMTRCLNVGTVSAENAYSVYYAKKGTIGEASDLFYKSGVGGTALEAIEVSESELKNGKVAFQLWNSNWGQSIGNNSVNDAYPIPNKRDYKVYHTDYTSDYYYNYITSTVPTGDFTTTIETAYSKNGIRIGDTRSFTVTFGAGKYISSSISLNGKPCYPNSRDGNVYTFSYTVELNNVFSINLQDIGCTVNLNQSTGTINVADNILGSTETFTVTPKTGYYIKDATIHGSTIAGTAVSGKTDGTKSFSFTVKESNTVTINTAAIACTTTLNQTTSTLNVKDNILGSTETFTATPKAGYYIKNATINGTTSTGKAVSGKTDGTKSFSFTVKESNTVTINTAAISCTTTLNQSTGTIDLADNIIGSTETFTVTPKGGYCIVDATINGKTISGTTASDKTDGTNTFSFKVQENNTIVINTMIHDYINGICSNCGKIETGNLVGDFYEIGNEHQLYWFASQVNSGQYNINAVLTADIVINRNVLDGQDFTDLVGDGSDFRIWTPIGTDADEHKFMGIFDGQGHTISGLYYNDSNKDLVGLFGASGGIIKNVGIIDSYFCARMELGALCGTNLGTIINCYNHGVIQTRNQTTFMTHKVGGVCGYNLGTITNCYNKGQVYPNGGGICGDCDENGVVTNCFFRCPSYGMNYGSGDATWKDDSPFASGEVAWLLNRISDPKYKWSAGPTDGSQAWYQTLGEDGDPYPVLKSNGSNTVYFFSGAYTNTPLPEPIVFEDGIEYTESSERADMYVQYKREFLHTGWQAFFVPFSMNYEEWERYGRVAELGMVSGSNGNFTLIWNILDEGSIVEAGKPYIFEPNTASDVFIEILGTTLKAASCARSVTVQAADGTIITLSGTFDGKNDMKTSGAYALQGGAFKKASSDDAVLKPQRIYLTISPGVSTKSVPSSISCEVVNK